MKHFKENVSLLKLAILLVAIGFIAVVWAASGYLRQSLKLHTIITEIETFHTAVGTFRQHYGYLPGDLPNATAYWFNDTSCPGQKCCKGMAWRPRECNGNGDGKVSNNVDMPDNDETLRAWQHLVLADMLEGPYAGTGEDDVPSSEIQNIAYHFHYENRNSIRIASAAKEGAVLTPMEAYTIDKKTDDGKPLQGDFLSMDGVGAEGCINLDGYDVTNTGVVCVSNQNVDG